MRLPEALILAAIIIAVYGGLRLPVEGPHWAHRTAPKRALLVWFVLFTGGIVVWLWARHV
jgi:hypothetical protein